MKWVGGTTGWKHTRAEVLMKLIYAMTLVMSMTASGWTASPDFYGHWGDGKAEISSYRVVQPRYGEHREGYGVMIFVTEDMNRNTMIKVESPTPKEERLYVLKLNNVLKFTTGIYDYSVMTSVFSAVEGYKGNAPFELVKVNLSSQEWCGHVFDEARVVAGQIKGELNSYFEREGKHPYSLDLPTEFESEDHLLIRIRELKSSSMAPGTSRDVSLMRSLWSIRTRHRPHSLVPGKISKGMPGPVTAGEERYEAIPWTISTEGWEKTIWVEAAYPHRIVKWEDSAGGRGVLMKTVRAPYWSMKKDTDLVHRDHLGIPR